MEHANGTAININSGSAQIAGVSAHEFFHLWNVKRIRPASLEPVDYTREQYSRALWFAEGVTSTYGSYAQVRSGTLDEAGFLRRSCAANQRTGISPRESMAERGAIESRYLARQIRLLQRSGIQRFVLHQRPSTRRCCSIF